MSKQVTNKKQLELLVSFMEDNPDAKGVCTKTVAKNRWETLSSELNSYRLPVRSLEKWMKVWTDYKWKIKKKSENKLEMIATRGGPNKLHTFNQLEESVSNLLVISPPGLEFGLSSHRRK